MAVMSVTGVLSLPSFLFVQTAAAVCLSRTLPGLVLLQEGRARDTNIMPLFATLGAQMQSKGQLRWWRLMGNLARHLDLINALVL